MDSPSFIARASTASHVSSETLPRSVTRIEGRGLRFAALTGT